MRLDAIAIGNNPPDDVNVIIEVPIGVFQMQDDSGVDEKIIAVPVPKLTRRYDGVKSYKDMPGITIEQIQHFFEHYKDLEPGKWVKSQGWGDVEAAKRFIKEAIARHNAQSG